MHSHIFLSHLSITADKSHWPAIIISESLQKYIKQLYRQLRSTSVYIPVKVVLVMGGGLHIGDLLLLREQTQAIRRFPLKLN